MALKGLKSIKNNRSLTDDMRDHLLSEGFKVRKKIESKAHIPTLPIELTKLWSDEASGDKYMCYVTGNEIFIEVEDSQNDFPHVTFNETFEDEESFVEVYNNFVEKYFA